MDPVIKNRSHDHDHAPFRGDTSSVGWDSWSTYVQNLKSISNHYEDRKDDANSIVRPSGRGTVHSRPHKMFLHFHDLWTLLNKIREGVAQSPFEHFA